MNSLSILKSFKKTWNKTQLAVRAIPPIFEDVRAARNNEQQLLS